MEVTSGGTPSATASRSPGHPALPDTAPLSPGDLARIAAAALDANPFPALVLDIPSGRIVAASPAAMRLLNPDGEMVVGHLLEEFTADQPTIGLNLFSGGRLNGFETFRLLRRSTGPDVKVRMWIRSFEHQPAEQLVVVVIVADDPASAIAEDAEWKEAPAVFGTADASLVVERISSDAESLFNQPMDRMLGRSLLSLIAQKDVATCLAALSETSAGENGITLYLSIRTGDDAAMRCEVLLLPLQPTPSCAFVFLPMPDGLSGGHFTAELSAILLRLGRAAEIAQLARGVFRGVTERSVPGLSKLTTRELEIVGRLLDGDRAPAIAGTLFLSQSTVRNHLASVFAKLGVTSQQELLTVMREAQATVE